MEIDSHLARKVVLMGEIPNTSGLRHANRAAPHLPINSSK